MAKPDRWPDRPAVARFRLVVAVKPDGRRVAYYDWPEDPDGDDPLDQVTRPDATPAWQVDKDV